VASASLFGQFIAEENTPLTQWIKGWVDLRSGLEMARRKLSCLCWQLNLGSLVAQPVALSHTDWSIAAPLYNVEEEAFRRSV
jgi:hypothetical protein